MPFIKILNKSEHSTWHDEQTISANPVLVYRRIRKQDEVEIEAAAIFPHYYWTSTFE